MSRTIQREMWFYGPTYPYNFLRILHLSVSSIGLLSLAIATSSNDNNDRLSKIACEKENLSISCNGNTISIDKAFYGRRDKVTCVERNDTDVTPWNTNCRSHKATEVVKEKCNNQPSCTLNTENKERYYNSLFGDPCSGTPKYLSANYTCLPVTTASPPNTASISKRKAPELTSDGITKSGFADEDFSEENGKSVTASVHNGLVAGTTALNTTSDTASVDNGTVAQTTVLNTTPATVAGATVLNTTSSAPVYSSPVDGTTALNTASATASMDNGPAAETTVLNTTPSTPVYSSTVARTTALNTTPDTASLDNSSVAVTTALDTSATASLDNYPFTGFSALNSAPSNGSMSTSALGLTGLTPTGYSTSSAPTTFGCHCLTDSKRNVEWPTTECGNNANESCPNNKRRRKAYRECSKRKSTGEWMHPNLFGCITEEIEMMRNETDYLIKIDFSVDSTKEMMSRVKNISECNDLYGGDLYELTRVMVDLVKFSSENVKMLNYSEADNLTEMVLNSTGKLLSNVYNETWMDLSPADRSQTAARLLDALETSCTVLAKTADSTKSINKAIAGIELQINVFNITQIPSDTSTVTFKTPDVQIDFELKDVKARSYNADGKLGFGRTTFILYDDIAMWLDVNQSTPVENTAPQNGKSSVESSIISKVVSASIVSFDPHSTETPARFTIHHQSKQLNSTITNCVFWKFSQNGSGGHWSKDGLKVVSSNSHITTCKSCHLTNFAILMSAVEVPKDHRFALQVITYIGCTISIVCLALALCTFCVFRNLQSDRNTIHKNLVLCLLVSELIFVFGITQYGIKLLCAVVAGFLHYFLLASFAWMCLEGVQLYVLLIEVFESEKSRVKWYYLGGYGIPAVIVSISVSVNIYMKVTLEDVKDCGFISVFQNEYGAYGTEDYCWLSLEMDFIWAFIGPALAIIAMNSVMLGVAIYTMCKHASKTASWKLENKSRIYAIGSWLRGAAILVVLLGTTWSFGLGMLYESGHTVPMAYIFTVLNSLQGFFIFVFHCLTNDKVQTEYQRVVQRSTWLPENVRVKFGGAGETLSPSATDRKPLFQRIFARNKRKDSSSSISVQEIGAASCGLRNRGVFSHPKDESRFHGSAASEPAHVTESPGLLSQDSSAMKIAERHELSYVCAEPPKIRIQRAGAVEALVLSTGHSII